MTGIHHTHACTAKNEMIAMGIVVANGSTIGINKVVSDWKFNISQHSETLAKSANKRLAEVANTHSPSQLNTKETIQKIKENTPNPLAEVVAVRVKPTRRKPIQIDYPACMNFYNELVGDRLPHAVELSDERKRKLRTLVTSLATPTAEGFRAYVKAFLNQARPFHFGDNDREWVANFDYLLRRKVLTAIREGTL
jgi:hypothetical protein